MWFLWSLPNENLVAGKAVELEDNTVKNETHSVNGQLQDSKPGAGLLFFSSP